MVAALLALISHASVPSAGDLDRAVVAYRQSMDRMTVVWRSASYDFPDNVRTKMASRVTRLWRDKRQLRTDVVMTLPTSQSARELVCRNCEQENTSVVFFDSGSKKSVLNFAPLTDTRFRTIKTIDPRFLGMVPTFSANLNLANHSLGSFIGRPDREKVTVELSKWKEEDAWLMRYRLLQGSGVDVRAWVVPKWGPSVTRIEAEWKVPQGVYLDSVECTYQQTQPQGKWYPKTCGYQRKLNGKPVKEEDLEVDSIAFDDIVPADAFRLTGMEIPRGMEILGLNVPGRPRLSSSFAVFVAAANGL